MNRTRIIFFGILAVYLGIVATALALDIASSNLLWQIFIGSTVFSLGVVLLDFLGILGGHHGGDTAGDVTAGHFAGDHDVGGHLDTGHIAGHVDAGHAPAGDSGAGHDAGQAPAHPSGEASPASSQQSAAPILSALTYLRLFVYFCLGFGPMGLVAMASGRSPLTSLLLAIPVGVIAVFLAQAFFRFQRRDIDSQLASADLVGQAATVIVPLDDKTMGKVRIQVGPVVTEQYALAARPDAAFENGDRVMVTSVTDECVYVR
jgi:membrane protein implicated in regulation of membrane protease activity